jgi:hypothetical protein
MLALGLLAAGIIVTGSAGAHSRRAAHGASATDLQASQEESQLLGGPADVNADYLQPSGSAADAFLAPDSEVQGEALTPTEALVAANDSATYQIRSNGSGPAMPRASASLATPAERPTGAYPIPDLALGQSTKAPVRAPFDGMTVYPSPW